MSKLLLIRQDKPGYVQAALLDDGELLEYYHETPNNRSKVGDIYRGKVRKVASNMQAIFIDIGLSELGFLAARDAGNAAKKHNADLCSLFKEGQIVWVQVTKDNAVSYQGVAKKGLRLTTELHLETDCVIYFPNNHHVHISKKIIDHELREDLKTELVQEKARHGIQGGFIVRSIVEQIAKNPHQSWLPNVETLWQEWQSIKLSMREAKKSGLIYQTPAIAARLKGRCYSEKVDRVSFFGLKESFVIDGVETENIDAQQMQKLWEENHIDKQLDVAMHSVVELAQGGSIVIEQTEALVSIDVNMGSAVHEGLSVLQVNLNAANLIVRQLRLRNLSGIIIIDFIDMDDKSERKVLFSALKKACEQGDGYSKVLSYTKLGLIEMTRERTTLSLRQMLDNV